MPPASKKTGPRKIGKAEYHPYSHRLAGPGGEVLLPEQLGRLAALVAEALQDPKMDRTLKHDRMLAVIYKDRVRPASVKAVLRQLVFRFRKHLQTVQAGVDLVSTKELGAGSIGWVVQRPNAPGTEPGT